MDEGPRLITPLKDLVKLIIFSELFTIANLFFTKFKKKNSQVEKWHYKCN